MASLQELLQHVVRDEWRTNNGFSQDIADAAAAIRNAADDDSRARLLGRWLRSHQPCLFGRVAAQRNMLAYCMLTVDDIDRGDDFVRDKIQTARTNWSREALAGRQSGFVIALISSELEHAMPNDVVRAIAVRLCGLYLLKDDEQVGLDTILLDNIRLEAPLPGNPMWEWDVGVNYFSAQGDRRWWHDHRIPVGMALSMNSVGHMVKATIQAAAVNELAGNLNVAINEFADSTVDSLGKALKFAMMTIERAAQTASGPATWLQPHPGAGRLPRCPIELPAGLVEKDYCEYRGYYHTDATLPTVYFLGAVDRPGDVPVQRLDFTYLNEFAADQIDWRRAAEGRRIRDDYVVEQPNQSKRAKGTPALNSEAGGLKDKWRVIHLRKKTASANTPIRWMRHDDSDGMKVSHRARRVE